MFVISSVHKVSFDQRNLGIIKYQPKDPIHPELNIIKSPNNQPVKSDFITTIVKVLRSPYTWIMGLSTGTLALIYNVISCSSIRSLWYMTLTTLGCIVITRTVEMVNHLTELEEIMAQINLDEIELVI